MGSLAILQTIKRGVGLMMSLIEHQDWKEVDLEISHICRSWLREEVRLGLLSIDPLLMLDLCCVGRALPWHFIFSMLIVSPYVGGNVKVKGMTAV